MDKTRNKFWFIPFTVNEGKHKASLLELFLDLILVASVGGFVERIEDIFEKLTHGTNASSNSFTFEPFYLVFSIFILLTTILIWRSYTIYSSKYEYEYNLHQRLITFMLMLGLTFTAIGMYIDYVYILDNFQYTLIMLIIGYTISFLTILYCLVTTMRKSINPYEKYKLKLQVIGILFMFIPVPAILTITAVLDFSRISLWITIIVWGSSTIIWIYFELLSKNNKLAVNTFDTNLKHLQERFGIIFIVFIGEIFLQIIIASSDQVPSSEAFIVSIKVIAMFATTFSWWWFFNDILNTPDIINHPRKIVAYTYSMVFILIALAITAAGFSLIINIPSHPYGQWLVAIGITLWIFSSIIAFLSLKNYNLERKIYFPHYLRGILYSSPIIFWMFLWTAFYDQINSRVFIFVIAGLSLTIIFVPTFVFAKQVKSLETRKTTFEEVVKKYMTKEDKWIQKNALKNFDLILHKEFNYKLNHYSKYIKVLADDKKKSQYVKINYE